MVGVDIHQDRIVTVVMVVVEVDVEYLGALSIVVCLFLNAEYLQTFYLSLLI